MQKPEIYLERLSIALIHAEWDVLEHLLRPNARFPLRKMFSESFEHNDLEAFLDLVLEVVQIWPLINPVETRRKILLDILIAFSTLADLSVSSPRVRSALAPKFLQFSDIICKEWERYSLMADNMLSGWEISRFLFRACAVHSGNRIDSVRMLGIKCISELARNSVDLLITSVHCRAILNDVCNILLKNCVRTSVLTILKEILLKRFLPLQVSMTADVVSDVLFLGEVLVKYLDDESVSKVGYKMRSEIVTDPMRVLVGSLVRFSSRVSSTSILVDFFIEAKDPIAVASIMGFMNERKITTSLNVTALDRILDSIAVRLPASLPDEYCSFAASLIKRFMRSHPSHVAEVIRNTETRLGNEESIKNFICIIHQCASMRDNGLDQAFAQALTRVKFFDQVFRYPCYIPSIVRLLGHVPPEFLSDSSTYIFHPALNDIHISALIKACLDNEEDVIRSVFDLSTPELVVRSNQCAVIHKLCAIGGIFDILEGRIDSRFSKIIEVIDDQKTIKDLLIKISDVGLVPLNHLVSLIARQGSDKWWPILLRAHIVRKWIESSRCDNVPKWIEINQKLFDSISFSRKKDLVSAFNKMLLFHSRL
jgi:hypothetical protein